MELVNDRNGNRYQLLKRSTSSYLVRDIDTGRLQYIDRRKLIDDQANPQTTNTDHDIDFAEARLHPQSLPVLCRIQASNGTTSRQLLHATKHCESALFMLLRDLEVGEYVSRNEEVGRTTWQTTPKADAFLERIDHSMLISGGTTESD